MKCLTSLAIPLFVTSSVLADARAAVLRPNVTVNADVVRLSDLFDDVVVSAEVGLAKPDPEVFRLAARRLGVPPEACVFVDDWEVNVAAAREVGMAAVHFRRDKGDDLAVQLAALGLEAD